MHALYNILTTVLICEYFVFNILFYKQNTEYIYYIYVYLYIIV